MSSFDFSSITAIRRHLEKLKIETRTEGVRGETRKQILEGRLRAYLKSEPPNNSTIYREIITHKASTSTIPLNDSSIEGINWNLVTDLRNELQKRGINSQTPGIRGEERRLKLTERLKAVLKENSEFRVNVESKDVNDVIKEYSTAKKYSNGTTAFFQDPLLIPKVVEGKLLISHKTTIKTASNEVKSDDPNGQTSAILSQRKENIALLEDMISLNKQFRISKSIHLNTDETKEGSVNKFEANSLPSPTNSIKEGTTEVESEKKNQATTRAVLTAATPTIESSHDSFERGDISSSITSNESKFERCEYNDNTNKSYASCSDGDDDTSSDEDSHKLKKELMARQANYGSYIATDETTGISGSGESNNNLISLTQPGYFIDEEMVSNMNVQIDQFTRRINQLNSQISKLKSERKVATRGRVAADHRLIKLHQKFDTIENELERAISHNERFINSNIIHGNIRQRYRVEEFRTTLINLRSQVKDEMTSIESSIEQEECESKYYGIKLEMMLAIDRSKLEDQIDDIHAKLGDMEDQKKSDSLSSRAVFLQGKGMTEKAVELFEKALKCSPKHGMTLLRFALFQRDIYKNYPFADRLFRAAVKAMPRNCQPLFELGVMLHRKNQHKAAEPILRKCLILSNNSHVDALSLLGLIQSSVYKNEKAAEKLYDEALNLVPNHAKTLVNYANLKRNLKDYEGANSIFSNGMSLCPNNSSLLYSYATFLREDYPILTANSDDYITNLYEKAIECEPNNVMILGSYASFCKTKLKLYDRSKELYLQSLSINPTHTSTLGGYAGLLKTMGEYDDAELMFRKSVERLDATATLLGNFANFLKNIRHSYDEARVFYHRALRKNPNHKMVRRNYAIFLRDCPEIRQSRNTKLISMTDKEAKKKLQYYKSHKYLLNANQSGANRAIKNRSVIASSNSNNSNSNSSNELRNGRKHKLTPVFEEGSFSSDE